MTTHRNGRVFARPLVEILEEALAILRQDASEYAFIGLVGAVAAGMAVLIPALIGGPIAMALSLIAPLLVASPPLGRWRRPPRRWASARTSSSRTLDEPSRQPARAASRSCARGFR